MPYVLLAIGLLLALYGLYKFMIVASPKQAGALILAIFTLVVAGALLVLTLTGRLPAALAILLALWPLALSFWKRRKTPARPASDKPMTRDEALAILGLSDGADADSIQEAYKRLMMKIHPDQQGSEWMAAKLNAARDYLLK
jgi:4-amino-4-deoxy-L-arabinose transferase-like glycosyltransferase